MSEQSISELEHVLSEAKERVKRVCKTFTSEHEASDWEGFDMAYQQQLSAERSLAAAKGEEHAVPIDFPAKWDTGAPLPYLLKNDYRTFLAFFLAENDPNWDGSYVNIRNPSDISPSSIAVVEFKHCQAAKMGSPNDEVHSGHTWDGRGLDSYTAQEIINSHWIAELESINSVHACYDPEMWKQLHHYVLWFHDSTFECIAESFEVTFHDKSLAEVLVVICEQLLD